MEICRELCEQRGYEVIGYAEDLDVSGSVDPFDRKRRPELSRWLANEAEPFDVIVVYRVDRLTRSLRNLQRLVNWADDNDKLVVSATEPHFDTTSPFAGVLIALIGTVAEMELEAIRERTASAARHNIRAGKWRGGQPPWGYVPDNSSGEWRLAQSPEQVVLINEVVARVLDGEPMQRIAHDLTRRGIPTPKGRTEWNVTPLKRSLLSETMLGYAIYRGKPVRNDDGSPVIRATPILTREVFERVRVELEGRAGRGEPTTRTSALLLRVLHCGVCGMPAYKFNGGSHSKRARYRCKSMVKAVRCGNKTTYTDVIDGLVERVVLNLLGKSERLERVWDSGSDHSGELVEINAELVELTSLIGSPAYRSGTPQRNALDIRIAALATRQDALSQEVAKPAGWAWAGTGEPFSDWWERQDVIDRNVWLRSMNIRAEYDREGIHLDLGDLNELARRVGPSGGITQWQEIFKAMSDNQIQGLTLGEDGSVTLTPRSERPSEIAR